ncbi:MAG: hypothetical protein AB1578_11280 [Thermodesulfobacteriota bacterium]
MIPCPRRHPLRAALPAAALAVLLLSGCASLLPGAREEAPAVLHPQVSRSTGTVWLQPRHAREPLPLTGPLLLEPGDRLETGPDGKVEVLLPGAAVRAYGGSRFQVLYAFEGRRAGASEVRVEEGEVLVRRLGSEPLPVQTEALRVEVGPLATVLVGSRGAAHHAACYEGRAEARNSRVRGQTVVWIAKGQRLTLDDAATVAYLQDAKLPAEWSRWETPSALTAGIVPPPTATERR